MDFKGRPPQSGRQRRMSIIWHLTRICTHHDGWCTWWARLPKGCRHPSPRIASMLHTMAVVHKLPESHWLSEPAIADRRSLAITTRKERDFGPRDRKRFLRPRSLLAHARNHCDRNTLCLVRTRHSIWGWQGITVLRSHIHSQITQDRAIRVHSMSHRSIFQKFPLPQWLRCLSGYSLKTIRVHPQKPCQTTERYGHWEGYVFASQGIGKTWRVENFCWILNCNRLDSSNLFCGQFLDPRNNSRQDISEMNSWGNFGRLIFIHLQCWEALPFCRFQRQRCIKILCPKDPDFYTPLALKMAKGQRLPALEVYKNQSPKFSGSTAALASAVTNKMLRDN